MWPKTFAHRLESWYQLRSHAQSADLATALNSINQWWFNAPWIPYHLHWDDRAVWPDPWQLLSDNTFCGLARALGMLYTITLIDRADLQDCVLQEHVSDNLVLVPGEKYILNWDRACIVNITPGEPNLRRCVSQPQLKQLIG